MGSRTGEHNGTGISCELSRLARADQGHQVAEAATTGRHPTTVGSKADTRGQPMAETSLQATQRWRKLLSQKIVIEASRNQIRSNRDREGWRIEVS